LALFFVFIFSYFFWLNYYYYYYYCCCNWSYEILPTNTVRKIKNTSFFKLLYMLVRHTITMQYWDRPVWTFAYYVIQFSPLRISALRPSSEGQSSQHERKCFTMESHFFRILVQDYI
jgi:hypothetical protein